MQYYDVTKKEFEEKYADLHGDEWNSFIDEHFRSTCTACGKDYNYTKESPIVKDEVWRKMIETLKLEEFERASSENHKRYCASKMKILAQRVAEDIDAAFKNGIEWKRRRYRYLFNIVDYEINTPDDCHCTLCEACMEKGLGRKLQVSDIETCCTLGMEYAVEHFGKEVAEREREKEKEKHCD